MWWWWGHAQVFGPDWRPSSEDANLCVLCESKQLLPKLIVTAACGVAVVLLIAGYLHLLRKGISLRMWKGTVALLALHSQT